MAGTREFNSEKQSKQPKEKDPAQFNPTPEAIDNMVSNFLAELKDLSSEMSCVGDLGSQSTSEAEPEADEAKTSRHLKPEEESRRQWVPDLERIDEEIEQALAELETWKPASHQLKEVSSEEDQPAAVEPSAEVTPSTPVRAVVEAPTAKSEPKAEGMPGNGQRLFERSIYVSAKAPRRGMGFWVLAVFILMGLAVSAYFYYFGAANEIQQGAVPRPSSVKPAPPAAESDENRSTVQGTAPEIAAPTTENAPVETVKPGFRESDRSASIPRNTARSSDSGAPQASGPAGTAPEIRPPAETAGSEFLPERTIAKREPLRPAFSRDNGTGIVSAKPASTSTAEPAASQSKPVSMIPKSINRSNESTGPAAPKSALQNEEAAHASVELKTEDLIPAEVVTRFDPEYPAEAQSQKVQGLVELEAVVNEKGDVIRVKAVSGPFPLRTAAEIAALKWKFRPASVNGVNTSTTEHILMTFKLQ
jgi:TonB family protein